MSILLIDDDVRITELVAGILESDNYEVLVVNKPEEAMAVATTVANLELVISDAVMPGISGPEVVDQLVQKYPSVKVLFVTGLDRLAIQVAFGGACEYIQKPFRGADLIEMVRGILSYQGPDNNRCRVPQGVINLRC